tara:strand:+ start:221 stop:1297 length:1077 start_codon:yes stop_codon:yes gene_type:complete
MRVCIIGSGLSGLTLAKALVNKKINVDVIKSKKVFEYSKSRTLGISKSNIKFINENIINIEKIIWKLKKIEIFTENLKNEKLLEFESKKRELFSIVKNYKLYEILYKSLSKNKFYKEINRKKTLDLNNSYNLIINTDVNHIFMNKFFNKKIIKKYYSFAHTTIITHKKIDNNVASQIFTKQGPLAFLPISNSETSIVYSIYNSKRIDIENIKNLIYKHNFKYEIINIKEIKSFELKSLSLRSYYYKNILAFGDLLHQIHPLAGQGFNMTIRDIRVLIKVIIKRLNLGLDLDASTNIEFEKKIKHKNFIFENGIDFIYEFFNVERKFKNNILSKSVQLIGRNPSLNKLFTKIADEGILF